MQESSRVKEGKKGSKRTTAHKPKERNGSRRLISEVSTLLRGEEEGKSKRKREREGRGETHNWWLCVCECVRERVRKERFL